MLRKAGVDACITGRERPLRSTIVQASASSGSITEGRIISSLNPLPPGRSRWRLLGRCLALLLAAMAAAVTGIASGDTGKLVVGSKRFTESYVLAEIVAQTAAAAGPPKVQVEHRPGLGNTAVVFEALKAGSIDLYPEYLGTIDAEILKNSQPGDIESMRRQLAPLGLGVAVPLGFNNGYALAMKASQAKSLGVASIGDLKAHGELSFGLSHEFLGRADGWPGLAARYGLPQRPTGIDHGISYEALSAGRIAATDIYTTDSKIASLGLAVLDDDLHYFPRYDAVLLYRLDTAQRFPAAWQAIGKLEGRIDVDTMIRMNGEAELKGRAFADIARDFVGAGAAGSTGASAAPAASTGRTSFMGRLVGDDLGRLTREHVTLVLVALVVATVIGIPLGALAAALPKLEQGVMGVVGLLQTIPSLALFAMLIPLLGRIGLVPALVALSAYALLPIVRNTATGLSQVSPGLKQAGVALGLTPSQRWRSIDLPLAAPVILAGVKTAAVITVGTATIAAFIGAGGYGERIATGLALNDHAALLAGAIPAAVLAIVTQLLFETAERLLLPGGQRLSRRLAP